MDPLDFKDLLTPELVGTFVAIAIANLALVTTLKNALARLSEGGVRALSNPWVKAAMEFCQPTIGGLLGYHSAVFPDFPPFIGALLGVVAGFLSPAIYKHVLKKYAPELVVSSEASVRKNK